jgi:hypothetical protein
MESGAGILLSNPTICCRAQFAPTFCRQSPPMILFLNFQLMEMPERRAPMFDDVLRAATLCAENFRDGVRDSFGASMIADVLDPILKEIHSLRDFNEEFQRQSLRIDQLLEEARTTQFKVCGGAR